MDIKFIFWCCCSFAAFSVGIYFLYTTYINYMLYKKVKR